MKIKIKVHPNSSKRKQKTGNFLTSLSSKEGSQTKEEQKTGNFLTSLSSKEGSQTKEEIKKLSNGNFEVWIKAKAEKNKANIELIKLLKKYFKKSVKISSGFSSRNKIIEIND